jgi:hypothetical protein
VVNVAGFLIALLLLVTLFLRRTKPTGKQY